MALTDIGWSFSQCEESSENVLNVENEFQSNMIHMLTHSWDSGMTQAQTVPSSSLFELGF